MKAVFELPAEKALDFMASSALINRTCQFLDNNEASARDLLATGISLIAMSLADVEDDARHRIVAIVTNELPSIVEDVAKLEGYDDE